MVAGAFWMSTGGKINLILDPTSYTKINSKQKIDSYVKCKMVECLEDNLEKHWDISA